MNSQKNFFYVWETRKASLALEFLVVQNMGTRDVHFLSNCDYPKKYCLEIKSNLIIQIENSIENYHVFNNKVHRFQVLFILRKHFFEKSCFFCNLVVFYKIKALMSNILMGKKHLFLIFYAILGLILQL